MVMFKFSNCNFCSFIVRSHCLHVDIPYVEFYMSPQCGQNVLHVACIQKLNIYGHHVSCISYISSVSGVKIDLFLHVSRSWTCSTVGHVYPVDQRMPVVPSTCYRSVDRNVLHFINIHEFTRSRL